MFFDCHLYLTTSVTKLLKILLLFSHLYLTTSVTKLKELKRIDLNFLKVIIFLNIINFSNNYYLIKKYV